MKHVTEISEKASEAASFIKLLSHPHRLLTLCHLVEGEKCVSDLLEIVQISQPALSQHLAKLKKANILATKQEQQKVFYRIHDPAALKVMQALYDIFCQQQGEDK